MTPEDLMTNIKEALGYPVVNLEITDSQIENQIRMSLRSMKKYINMFTFYTFQILFWSGFIEIISIAVNNDN